MDTAVQTQNNPPKKQEEKKQKTIGQFLIDDNFKRSVAAALPKHLRAERMLRIILTEIRKNPKLAECTTESFLSCVLQASQLGLEPGMLGHAYLIPFNTKKDIKGKDVWVSECQLIIGYKGMIDLTRRSGQVISIQAHVVDVADEFSYKFGLHPTLDHIPSQNRKNQLAYVYACAHFRDGGYQFEVLTKSDIEKIVGKAKMSSHIWQNHLDEMAKKTAIRRLFKYLPLSQEMVTASRIDEQAESGERQDFDIDITEYTDLNLGAQDQEALEHNPFLIEEPTKADEILASINQHNADTHHNSLQSGEFQ